jgi:hypothetical protein
MDSHTTVTRSYGVFVRFRAPLVTGVVNYCDRVCDLERLTFNGYPRRSTARVHALNDRAFGAGGSWNLQCCSGACL